MDRKMTRILHIESSARPVPGSFSRRLAADLLDRLITAHPGAVVTVRDLAADPLPHVDAAFVAAMFVPEDERSPEQRAAMRLSEALVSELEAADIVVVGAPMYNYGVPSALKAWIDHVVRARRTFRHTPEGPVGLLADRPVYIVSAAGGVYSEGATARMDFFHPYMRAVLGKIGLKDLRFIRVEGLALGPEASAAAVDAAERVVHASMPVREASALGVAA